ncbi:MAG: diguanylate cyclase (GGDEF)-like protein [Porticoccus sp.]|jgi:diguanylate cyclase (GGDEF)-like protein
MSQIPSSVPDKMPSQADINSFERFVVDNSPSANCFISFAEPIDLSQEDNVIAIEMYKHAILKDYNLVWEKLIRAIEVRGCYISKIISQNLISPFITQLLDHGIGFENQIVTFKGSEDTAPLYLRISSGQNLKNGKLESLWFCALDVTELNNSKKLSTTFSNLHLDFVNKNAAPMLFVQLDQPINIHTDKEKIKDTIFKRASAPAVSESWCEIIGINRDVVVSNPLSAMLATDQYRKIIHFMVENNFTLTKDSPPILTTNKNTGEQFWLQSNFQSIIFNDLWMGGWLTQHNVSELIETASKLKAEQKRHKSFIDKSAGPIACLEIRPPMPIKLNKEQQRDWLFKNIYIAEANNAYASWFYANSVDKLIGKRLADVVIHANGFDTFVDMFLAQNYNFTDIEWTQENPASGHLHTFLSSATSEVEDGYLTESWTSHIDVSARRKHLDKIQYQADHDSLTGAYSRSAYISYLKTLYKKDTPPQQFALFTIDLNMFKSINDSLGHNVADQCLILLAQRLTLFAQELEGEAIVARIGGDEFALVSTEITTQELAEHTAALLLERIKEHFLINTLVLNLSASIGIALAPEHGATRSELMSNADIAKNKAKASQLGAVIFDNDTATQRYNRIETLSELRGALKRNELELFFQPKLELPSRKIAGVEALLRWNHPDRGYISPSQFIPSAEATEIIHDISRFAIEDALASCDRWWRNGNHVPVAINISARNLLDPSILELMSSTLKRYSLPTSALEIEITENSLVNHSFAIKDWLDRLQELGIALSIDDFGTGFSSLSYLKRLPVTKLKIDHSFITNMLADSHDRAIVNSVINLGHNLNLKVVAEGVESAEVLNYLEEQNCDFAQGFHIAEPMPAVEFISWLDQQ